MTNEVEGIAQRFFAKDLDFKFRGSSEALANASRKNQNIESIQKSAEANKASDKLFSIPAKLIREKPDSIPNDTNLIFDNSSKANKNSLILTIDKDIFRLLCYRSFKKSKRSTSCLLYLGVLQNIEFCFD